MEEFHCSGKDGMHNIPVARIGRVKELDNDGAALIDFTHDRRGADILRETDEKSKRVLPRNFHKLKIHRRRHGRYLFSCGGEDFAIFQWEYKENPSEKAKRKRAELSEQQKLSEWDKQRRSEECKKIRHEAQHQEKRLSKQEARDSRRASVASKASSRGTESSMGSSQASSRLEPSHGMYQPQSARRHEPSKEEKRDEYLDEAYDRQLSMQYEEVPPDADDGRFVSDESDAGSQDSEEQEF